MGALESLVIINRLGIFRIIRITYNVAIEKTKRLKGINVSELGRDPGKIQMCQVTHFTKARTGSRIFCALKESSTVTTRGVGGNNDFKQLLNYPKPSQFKF